MDFIFISKNKLKENFLVSKGLKVFRERGQTLFKSISNEIFELYLYKNNNQAPFFLRFDNGDFIFSQGTLFYKRLYGNASLEALYEDFKINENGIADSLVGNFSVIIFSNNKLFIFNDFLGLNRIYHTDRFELISTSFLAISQSLKTKTISDQEVYEYIMRGSSYGEKTVLKEIKLFESGTITEVLKCNSKKKFKFNYQKSIYQDDFDKMVSIVSEKLLSIFSLIVDEFQSNISSALSGGYDSRLMIALLRRFDIQPYIYVYGSDKDLDVINAKRIADSEEFPLFHSNEKRNKNIAIDTYADIIHKNFYFYDGLGNTGIFNDGTDIITRNRRTKGGKIQINGGGGEIFRNFWSLPNRAFTSKELVTHAYDGKFYDEFGKRFNKDVFLKNFSKKIDKAVGANGSKLSRRQVEMVYPLFRLKYWQSLNNSVNIKLSNTLTPLIDPSLLFISFDIPLKFKQDGRFQAAVINKIDNKLATYMSNYGHSFSDEIPYKIRAKRFVVEHLPMFAKPLIRGLARKFLSKGAMPYYLSNPYLSKIFDLEDLNIKEYVDISKINNSDFLSRALTIEYLVRYSQDK